MIHVVAKTLRRPLISFFILMFLSIGFHQIIITINTINVLNYGSVDLPLESDRDLYIQLASIGETENKNKLHNEKLGERIFPIDLIMHTDISLSKEFNQKEKFIAIESESSDALKRIILKTDIDFEYFEKIQETKEIQGILSNSYKKKYAVGQKIELFQFSDTAEPKPVMMTILGFIERDDFNVGNVPSMLEIDGGREEILLFNADTLKHTNNHTVLHNYIFDQSQTEEMQQFVDSVNKEYNMVNIKQEVKFYKNSIDTMKNQEILKLFTIVGLMMIMLLLFILKKWKIDQPIDSIHRFVGASEHKIISYHKTEISILSIVSYAITFILLLLFPQKIMVASSPYSINLFSVKIALVLIGAILLINIIYVGVYVKSVKK